jgi:Uma2 family endonuclease
MIEMATTIPQGDYVPTADRRFVWRVGWAGYKALMALRGDTSGPRISYLDGSVELMAPSKNHESIKSRIGRLLETYCLARNIRVEPVGSWTLEDDTEEAAAEPDECYCFGPSQDRERPDLAIEVVWTSGGLNKLEIYRRLGVREVWWWKSDVLRVSELVDGAYVPRERSVHLPDLDLALVVELVSVDSNDACQRMLVAAKR